MVKLRVLLLLAAGASLPAVASAQVKACKTAGTVFGNPDYKGADKPQNGGSAKSDPPLAWRTMTFVGKDVYTSTGQEVWAVELATGNQRLVAGATEKAMPRLSDGPCAAARFANIQGIAVLPDGLLVVADNAANSVLQIASPGDAAKCAVTYVAGATKPNPAVSNPRPTDKDGPVGTSEVGYPQWPVADAAGNVYFVDGNTSKLKKMAADATHTVLTVASLPRDSGIQSYRGLTLLKDKLYATANNFSIGFVFEVDPKSGAVRKVLAAEGKNLPEIGPNMTASFSSITNDGKDLFVTGSGYIWRVTTGGKVTHVAGGGSPLEWPAGYDFKAPHPAKDVVLRYRVGDQTTHGSTASLAYNDGALYFRGKNFTPFIVRIDCK